MKKEEKWRKRMGRKKEKRCESWGEKMGEEKSEWKWRR
mgnify:CR=1 FL=1